MIMLFRNIIWFGRLLRGAGLDVHTGRLLDAVQAIGHVGLARREDVRSALRALLVHRHEDLDRFNRAFDLFWRRRAADGPLTELHSLGDRPRRVTVRATRPLETAVIDSGSGSQNDKSLDAAMRVYSPQEVRRRKDFAQYTEDEIQDAKAFLQTLEFDAGWRRTRRWSPGRGRTLDLGRLLRRNMKHGGEYLDLPRRRRIDKLRPLVLICDISGSMERYTRMLLHFVHALSQSRRNIDAYLFATRLTRVTDALKREGADEVVSAISRTVPDWSGGTRIGEALKTFNRQWGRRALSHGPVVLLISDGWDRGDPALLDAEIARLQRSCHRLIWLNPLLGRAGYEPLTRGMQVALKHVDDFLPAHNLASLESLADHLNRLGPARPARRRYQEVTHSWT
jgi:uncharacterized protein with von Willebrand factor type A (vWA) domain